MRLDTQSYEIAKSGTIPDPATDCDVAVSTTLIGFYCYTHNLLFYYKKDEYLKGNYGSFFWKKTEITGKAMLHGSGSEYIFTTMYDTSDHFTLAYTDSSQNIRSIHYYVGSFSPVMLSMGTEFFVSVMKYKPDQSKITWMIGYINKSLQRVWLESREAPNGLAVRDLDTSKARLYYSVPAPDNISFNLVKEDSDKYFNSNKISTVSLDSN